MPQLRGSSGCAVVQFALMTMLMAIPLSAQNQNYSFHNIDFPGGTSTQARGINQQGDIVGIYTDLKTGLIRGFRLSGTTFSTIDFPGATQTYPRGINALRNIVGFFTDSDGIFHGFLLDSAGYHQIDVPGSFATTA